MNAGEVVERIRKALRLARKAATDGERDAAMNAAKRMAEANGLDLDGIDGEGEDGGKAVVVNGKRVDIDAVETQLAAWIISRHFSICVAFEKMRRGGGVKVLWIGNRINIGVAQYAWNIMLRESVRYFDELLKASKVNPKYRGLYMRGFFFAIDKLLTEHPLRNDVEQADAERRKAEDLLKEREKMQEFKLSNPEGEGETDGDAIVKGLKDGAKVRLNRPVGGTDGKGAEAVGTATRRAIAE